jgi:signal transduction histidine kinase
MPGNSAGRRTADGQSTAATIGLAGDDPTVSGVDERFRSRFGDPDGDRRLADVLAQVVRSPPPETVATRLAAGDTDCYAASVDRPADERPPTPDLLLRATGDGDRRDRVQIFDLSDDDSPGRHADDTPTPDTDASEDTPTPDSGADDDPSAPDTDASDDPLTPNADGELVASVVSHDLRNPLDVAKAHLRVAQETGETDHLSTVADAHDRMERIIEDVLTLSRVGEPDRRHVDVAATARAAWDTVATGDAELVVESPPTADADPNTLERLFENLFRNVTEHAGSAPTVWLGAVADGFYVADDGPGIPPAERSRVFQSGYTGDGTGTGLGLAIVGRIVAAHGWEVRVAETDDGGARFEVVGLASPTER